MQFRHLRLMTTKSVPRVNPHSPAEQKRRVAQEDETVIVKKIG